MQQRNALIASAATGIGLAAGKVLSRFSKDDVAGDPSRRRAVARKDLASEAGPDILADVPKLTVDELSLDIEQLKLNVSLDARIARLLDLSLVVDAELGKTDIDLKDLDAQVAAIVRLDNVRTIVERVVEMIDRNPQLIADSLSQVGDSLEEAGEAASASASGAEGRLTSSASASGVGRTLGRVAAKATDAVTGSADDERSPAGTSAADGGRGIASVGNERSGMAFAALAAVALAGVGVLADRTDRALRGR